MTGRTRNRGGMSARWAGLAVAASALIGVTPTAMEGQDLWRSVEDAPDGYVRFAYEAREGVCGDGRHIEIHDDGHERERREGRVCEPGPVRIEMTVRGGTVVDLDAAVGGSPRVRSGDITDLGTVEPDAAAGFLFRLAEEADPRIGEDALFPATIARGVVAWPRLLEIARGEAHTGVRGQAVFWLGQAAGERATEGLTSIIEDEDELEVREAAIFALSQRSEPEAVDALISVARESPEPALRKRAIFWLGQRGADPRVLDLLEELLTGEG